MSKEKSRRPGRRPRAGGNVQSDAVATRYGQGERAMIEAAASAVGKEFGTFVRSVAVPAVRAVLVPPPSGKVEL